VEETALAMAQDKAAYAKTLLKEVEVYRSHCLFIEARKRAGDLIGFIRKNDRLKHREQILISLKMKIRQIEEEADAFEAVGLSSHLSPTDRTRIRKAFSSAFEMGTDASVYEAATAFLVFGQFKEALSEFRKLIKSKLFRVAAVKNIFRCYIGLSEIKQAVALYLKLRESALFPPEELDRVHYFLQSILKMKGVSRQLPRPKPAEKPPPPETLETPGPRKPESLEEPEPPAPEEVVVEPSLDILSVTLSYPDQNKKKKSIVLDVSFQRKNTINVIVPGKNLDLLNYLQPGKALEDLQFNSTDIIFVDDGVVHGKTEIRVGKKQGDYTVTIKLGSA
jgi:tetratricopeptide (TPR) repeat protein